MNFNKKMVIVALNLSFCGSVIGMNESVNFIPRTESEKQAFQVAV